MGQEFSFEFKAVPSVPSVPWENSDAASIAPFSIQESCMVAVPQHVLLDRVTRALAREGVQLRLRDPNKRSLTDPGDILILRPVRVGLLRRVGRGTSLDAYPGTLEELARELGALEAHERLVP